MEDIDDLLTKPGQGGKNSYMDDSGNPFTDEEAETKPPRGDGSAYQTKIKVGDVLINRYTVLSELGFGGMGIVYECLDKNSKEKVALKTVLPVFSENSYEMEQTRKNFQLVHRLHHPHIANYNSLEIDEVNRSLYLIMEYVNGQDIRKYLQKRQEDGSFLKNVESLLRQAADALDYAHEQKIIHKDIKPSNLMVDFDGNLKLLDFGIASEILTTSKRNNKQSSDHAAAVGTLMYMSPEQFAARSDKPAMDQYSLAATFYELISGRHLFNTTNEEVLRNCIMNTDPEPLENVPPAAANAIAKALSKDPADRFRNCREFAAAFCESENRKEEQLPPRPEGKPLSTEERIECYDLREDLEKEFSAAPPEKQFFPDQLKALRGEFESLREAKPDTVLLQSLKRIRQSLETLRQTEKEAYKADLLLEEIRKLEKEAAEYRIVPSYTYSKLKRLTQETLTVQDYAVAIHYLGELKKNIETTLASAKAEAARKKAEDDARRKAEEATRKKAEEAARRKAEEAARNKAAEEEKRLAEERRLAEEKSQRSLFTFSPDGKTILDVCDDKATHIEIPSGVTSIGNGVFAGCSNLTSVEIPSSVISIGEKAFLHCSNLTSVKIPSGVTSISDSVFEGCSSLRSIEIPSGVTSIGDYAFQECRSLKSVVIPSGVTKIGSSSFNGCHSLTSVEIPSSVTSIGNMAFYNCHSLTSVIIPPGVTGIGISVFHSCSSLTSVTIPSGVKVICDDAFRNCSKLSFVRILAKDFYFGGEVFWGCDCLEKIEIPYTWDYIKSDDFSRFLPEQCVVVPRGSFVAELTAEFKIAQKSYWLMPLIISIAGGLVGMLHALGGFLVVFFSLLLSDIFNLFTKDKHTRISDMDEERTIYVKRYTEGVRFFLAWLIGSLILFPKVLYEFTMGLHGHGDGAFAGVALSFLFSFLGGIISGCIYSYFIFPIRAKLVKRK